MGTLGKAIYTVGFWIRETGQAIDRLGCRLQGNYYFQEQRKFFFLFCALDPISNPSSDSSCASESSNFCLVIGSRFRANAIDNLSRHRTLMNIFDKAPVVDKDAFVAPSASITGDVLVGRGSSIWYGCVLRGDVNSISVGSGTNIQDNSLVHVAKSNLSGKVLPTIIGDNVTVGHSAVLHGCAVEDEAFVGMGATLLDGVVVEKHGMVAAGALVRQNTRIPAGEVWGGNPAKFLRKLTDEEIAFISQSATNYSNLAQVHAAEHAKPFDEIEFEKVLRKKFARRDEEYDSMLGVVRETPPELVLPNNILPDKAPKAS
ncbi:UDP-3-O-[3-hydroxymyristoyl] glucosamine N-acyltransferase LpxD [Trema orientale]|uniref:UDP-3-O-[3-hydroxymyristoyl] glucosamine N-acyltransferase LpxD n=1 Tax=Trema orientale TaxID=63057 RepID=A0A2P5F6N3_TREOI|nr:UDP-3-O-[3-hydroxymyristoyl] glucosamine N-acyltransferase LpxD [Trema orientale]